MNVRKKTDAAYKERLQTLLRSVRLEFGLRQSDLAALIDRPQSFVSKYESGERRLDLVELHQVCKAIGIPLEEFVRRFEQALIENTSELNEPKIP